MVPTPEAELLRGERAARLEAFSERACKALKTRRQREWFRAIQSDVLMHGGLNLARVAGAIGRNRSSALRALAAIRTQLEDMGAKELLTD